MKKLDYRKQTIELLLQTEGNAQDEYSFDSF